MPTFGLDDFHYEPTSRFGRVACGPPFIGWVIPHFAQQFLSSFSCALWFNDSGGEWIRQNGRVASSDADGIDCLDCGRSTTNARCRFQCENNHGVCRAHPTSRFQFARGPSNERLGGRFHLSEIQLAKVQHCCFCDDWMNEYQTSEQEIVAAVVAKVTGDDASHHDWWAQSCDVNDCVC